MDTQIVILAAGKGTRMGGEIPKVLIPLDDRPVISCLLDNIKDFAKGSEPVIVVGFQEELVKKTLGAGYNYVTQFDQKGTAHAVLSAQQSVTSENFVVLYGDMPFISSESLIKLEQLHLHNQAMISMFTCKVPSFDFPYEPFSGYGRIIRNSDNEIQKIVEYKDCSDIEKTILEVNPGIYMFKSAWVWDQLKRIGSSNSQGEYYLTDIIELAMKSGEPILSLDILPEEVYGINTPDHLEHAKTIVNKKQ